MKYLSLLGYEYVSSSYKLSLSFTMKFPHHLSIAANTITTGHQNGGHVMEVNESGTRSIRQQHCFI